MFTVEEYQAALTALGGRIREHHRRMLAAHAAAPNGLLDVFELAAAAGQNSDNFTYAQYGALGHMIGTAISPKHQEYIWTRIIGEDSREPSSGVIVWRMHDSLQ